MTKVMKRRGILLSALFVSSWLDIPQSQCRAVGGRRAVAVALIFSLIFICVLGFGVVLMTRREVVASFAD